MCDGCYGETFLYRELIRKITYNIIKNVEANMSKMAELDSELFTDYSNLLFLIRRLNQECAELNASETDLKNFRFDVKTKMKSGCDYGKFAALYDYATKISNKNLGTDKQFSKMLDKLNKMQIAHEKLACRKKTIIEAIEKDIISRAWYLKEKGVLNYDETDGDSYVTALSADELWEKCKRGETVTSYDIERLDTSSDDSPLVFYNDGFLRHDKPTISNRIMRFLRKVCR